jgi:hypothetical protein
MLPFGNCPSARSRRASAAVREASACCDGLPKSRKTRATPVSTMKRSAESDEARSDAT